MVYFRLYVCSTKVTLKILESHAKHTILCICVMSANVLGAMIEPDIHTLVYSTELKHVIALTKATWFAGERGTTLSLSLFLPLLHTHTHTHSHTHTPTHTHTTHTTVYHRKDM
jgi:hypothetical protein